MAVLLRREAHQLRGKTVLGLLLPRENRARRREHAFEFPPLPAAFLRARLRHRGLPARRVDALFPQPGVRVLQQPFVEPSQRGEVILAAALEVLSLGEAGGVLTGQERRGPLGQLRGGEHGLD